MRGIHSTPEQRMKAMDALPRTPWVVAGELEAQREIETMYRKLCAEFMALDTRPMFFDGKSVSLIGPDPIPDNLREAYTQAAQRRAELEHELYCSRARFARTEDWP